MVFVSKRFLLVLGTALLASMMQARCSLAEEASSSATTPEDTSTTTATSTVDAGADAGAEPGAEPGAEADVNPNPSYEIQHPPKLPDMKNGGIFVYFHLYKTGGSSITELVTETITDLGEDLEDDEQSHVIFTNNREDMTQEDIRDSIQMVRNGNRAVFYNFHVEFPETMYPTLVEAASVLAAWREYADSQGVPFFLMTVLREPLAQALSFFNFFHVAVDEEEWSPFTGDLEPTEENFLKTYVPNRICHLMYDDAHGILEAPDFALRDGLLENIHAFMDSDELNRRNEPSFCNIDMVRKIIFTSGIFDFVGVTDNLSTHILPMIMEVVFGDHKLAWEADRKKDVEAIFEEDEVPPLRKNALTEATKEKIRVESAKDTQLYEEARERFAHWPKYS